MLINIQDDILKIQSLGLLDKLLADKITGHRIMWATDVYSSFNSPYTENKEISHQEDCKYFLCIYNVSQN